MPGDYFALIREDTFSTKPALTDAEWIDIISESLQGQHQFDTIQGATHETATEEGLGKYMWSGDFQSKLGPTNGIGIVLANLLGASTDQAEAIPTATPVYQHTFNSANAPGYGTVAIPRTVTALASRSNQLEQWNYLGGAVTRLNIEAVVNQDLRFTTEFIGDVDNTTGAADTPVAPKTAEYFSHHDSAFKIDIPGAKALDTDVEAWSLSIEAANTIVPNINTRFGRRAHHGALTITGRVDRDFFDMLYYEQFYGDTGATSPQDALTFKDVDIEIIGIATTTGTETGFDFFELEIKMPKIKFMGTEANVTGRDRITQGVPFQAFRDPTTTDALEVLLTNEVAAYPA